MRQPMMPPSTPPREQWQRRAMNVIGRARDGFPNWVMQYGIVVYIIALAAVSIMYSSYSMPWYYMLSGMVSVVVFFWYGRYSTDRLSIYRVKKQSNFVHRIFVIAFVPRLLWVLLSYYLFMQHYGDAFGFENGDALYYDELGGFVADLIEKGDFHFYDRISHFSTDEISDMGYGVYLGFVHYLTGKSIIAARLIKCIWSAYTVVLIYKLALRNFNPYVARIAAIFCALWPNFWYYCGGQLKEVEMVFLAILFVEQADQMLRSRQFTTWKVIPVLILGATMFTFRTPLALVALLAIVFSIVMSSSRVVNWGKRVIVGGLTVLLIIVTMGNQIEEQTQSLLQSAQSNTQKENMEWRGRREHGASVFAPMIFTLPFPTMVRPFDGQDIQQLLNGGNFCKNAISFFTIFAMITLLLSGRWREHLLPLSFMLGYLVVLTMSSFAQSERFHQPVMPFELMFAAYGLSIAVTKPKYKRWFMYWCGVMLIACVAWNWFKLAGRGLA